MLQTPRPSPRATAVLAPPIPTAKTWLAAYDGRHGPPVDLSQAVPGDPPAPALLRRLAEAAGDAAAARYGPILGEDALRRAYAALCAARYGAELDAGSVAITAGCNQAFFATVMTIAQAGDSVILPTPWYFNHQMTLEMLGIEPRTLPTTAEAGFVPDTAAAEALIDGSTRAIVLVSPNNPTGAVYPPAAIEAMFDLCRRRGLYLVLDETYRDFLAGAAAPHGLFGRVGWRDNLVSLYSFSKSFAISGHRLGAIAAGAAFLDVAATVLDSLQICPPRAAQIAVAASLDETAGWRRETALSVHARAETFRAQMERLPRWPIRRIGAYFAYLEHPFAGTADIDVARALAARLGLLVLPGSFFGPGQERYLRVACANVDTPSIERFAARLAAAGDLFPADRGEVR